MSRIHLKLILIALTVAALPGVAGALPHEGVAGDSVQIVRRVATTAQLAAEEYGLGVKDGKVVLRTEVDEARLFLGEARKAAAGLPALVGPGVVADLGRLIQMVDRAAPPDSLEAAVQRLVDGLARSLGVTVDEFPRAAPSLARGETIYRGQCASCHGVAGWGDGPAGRALTPPPAKLADAAFFHGSSPLDFYRRITIGVAGTGMASYEGALSLEDRWAVALYASTLRLPAARGPAPAALTDFAASAGLSDQALFDSLGSTDLARVAAVRFAVRTGGRDVAPAFALVRARIDTAFRAAAAGQRDTARSAAISAYMAFEGLERDIRVKDAGLVTRAEAAFARLREGAVSGNLAEVREELTRVLERSERTLGTRLTPVALFVQSFLILAREGLEAILVIGALIAFLVKVGASDRRRDIHLGVGAAVAMSLLTAIAIETVFRLGPAHQEALEGATMVVATVMLFSVSYWLISKMEVARWNQFVKSRLSEALSKRSMLALASVAFLAVYREGFETVLFYKALAVSGGTAETAAPIVAGFVAAAALLAAVYVAINRYGVRLPLRPFFAVTSGFLYLMAFVFAGTAMAELQEGGFIGITPIAGMFRAPTFGIYPTVESLAAQGVLMVFAAAALIWTFVVAPRRTAAIDTALAASVPQSRPRPRAAKTAR